MTSINPSAPEPRRHHAVPRLLLKGFAVERKRGKFQTRVFDKHTERSYASPIEDVMVERDFNAIEIEGERVSLEDYIGRFEALAAPLFERVLREASTANLTEHERFEIARFVALQFIRGTGHRAIFDDGAKQLAAEIERRGLPLAEHLDLSAQQIKAFGMVSVAKDLSEYASHMATKDMFLQRAPEGTEFILGDNPVVLDNQEPAGFWGNMGLVSKGIQIYLPLSSAFCLALWCPSHRARIEKGLREVRRRLGTLKAQAILGAKPMHVRAELLRQTEEAMTHLVPIERTLAHGDALVLAKENVVHLNVLQVAHAERFVISRHGEFDLPKRMLADDECYRRGLRIKVG